MDPTVFLAVILAAACHAGWNAIIKLDLEPIVAVSLVALGCGAVTLPLVPFVGLPARESWPWLAASVVIHLAYYIALAEAYRFGDMSHVYPLARGSAPLMTAIVANFAVGEALGGRGWMAIGLLTSGILLLTRRPAGGAHALHGRSVAFALTTSVTIMAYSIVDGLGVRASGNALAYSVWLFVLDTFPMLAFAWWRRPAELVAGVRTKLPHALAGGALSFAAYAIALWAMTKAPIALVAALRETSVLFGAIIAVVWLKEPLIRARVVATLLVIAGAVLLRYR